MGQAFCGGAGHESPAKNQKAHGDGCGLNDGGRVRACG